MSSIVEGFSITHAEILDGTKSFLSASLASAHADEYDIYGINEGSLDPDTDEYDNEGDDTVLSRWSWLNFAEVEVQSGYLSLPLIANLTQRPLEQIAASAAVNAVQTIGVTATGGTFTVTVQTPAGPKTTAALAFNITTALLATALQGLDGVDTNDVAVTGTAGTSYVLTWSNSKAGTPVQVSVNPAALTGGTATLTNTAVGRPATLSSVGLDLWHEDSMNTPSRPMILKMPSKDHLGAVRTLTIGLYKCSFKPITFDGPAYKDGLKVNYNATALMADSDELGVPFPDGKKRVGRLISHV